MKKECTREYTQGWNRGHYSTARRLQVWALFIHRVISCVWQRKSVPNMPFENLWNDIDWQHLQNVRALHLARVLIDYIPELKILSKEISSQFRLPPIPKHRMREGRKTMVQSLERDWNSGDGTSYLGLWRTNGSRPLKLLINCWLGLSNFEAQHRHPKHWVYSDTVKLFSSWVCGDGASYATTLRLQKYLCSLPDNHTIQQSHCHTRNLIRKSDND